MSVESQRDRAVTGRVGLLAGAFTVVSMPLYFVYDGAPPDWNVLTRVLLGIAASTTLLVFLAGLRRVLLTRRPSDDSALTVFLAAGTAWVLLTYVHLSLEAGTAISAPQPVDPTVDGVLAPAQFLMQGSIGRLLTAVVLVTCGLSIRCTHTLPAWTARAAFAVAAVQLAFVPSLYFGADPGFFYSAVGWGTTAAAPGLVIVWVIAVSIALLRTDRDPARLPTPVQPALRDSPAGAT